MSANFDNDVVVNLTTSPGAVFQRDFGIGVLHTDLVQAGFTEDIRYYDGEDSAKSDADLQQETIDALVAAFSQPLRLREIAVGKVNFANPLAGELDIVAAAAAAAGKPFYFSAMADRSEAKILEAAAWQEGEVGLFVPQTSDAAVLAGTAGNVLEDLAGFNYTRTAGIWHHDDTAYIGLAWLSTSGAPDPDQQATVWYHKSLNGFEAATVADPTELGNITSNNGNVYLPFKRRNVVNDGTTADGNFIDVLIAKDWFRDRTEAGAAQLLIDKSNAGQKLGYNNAGLNAMAGVVEQVIDQGIAAEQFESGRIINRPTRASSTLADRTARTARYPIEITLAGGLKLPVFDVVVLF